MKAYDLLILGSFGTAVYEHLRKLHPYAKCTLIDPRNLPDNQSLLSSKVYILVSARTEPRLCGLLDDQAHHERAFFLPMVIDDKWLRIGPLVAPGKGACWHCGLLRHAQHMEGAAAEYLILQDHYQEHPEAGPRGYFEPFAALGAAHLARSLRAVENSSFVAGSIWEMDLITTEVQQSTLVGVHGCSRCGLQRPADKLSYEQLQRECSSLWISPADPT